MYKLFLREKNINTENIKISKHREKKSTDLEYMSEISNKFHNH